MILSEVFRMATATQVPLSEYLNTAYSPDCDWIDGEVRERNMGEGFHAVLQKFFIMFLSLREKEWGIRVLPEQRVQTSATHFRIPDVCLARRDGPLEAIVRTPPLLCIEILSREDRMSEMVEKVEDYFGMGVRAVWVIDPRNRRVFSGSADGSLDVVTDQLTVAGTAVQVPVSEIFVELDELEGRV